MQAPDYLVPIRNPSRLPHFPHHLNLNEKESFSYHTWRELFAKAVENHVPIYVIAIVQLPKRNPNDKPCYKIYDGVTLRNYVREKSEPVLDPLTGEKKVLPLRDLQTQEEIRVDQIYYMAVRCFKMHPHGIKQAPLDGQTFTPLFPCVETKVAYIKQRMIPVNCWSDDEQECHTALTNKLRKIYPHPNTIPNKVAEAVEDINLYIMDSANFYSEDRIAVGKSQLRVAIQWRNLLDEHQAQIWAWCSSKNRNCAR